jgi:aryl-alcohol dehydrogenase-like predicted oxidoreductase
MANASSPYPNGDLGSLRVVWATTQLPLEQNRVCAAARDELVVATNVPITFPIRQLQHDDTPPISGDPLPDCLLDAPSVTAACDASLRRLQTNRIDLFHIHWPDRYLPIFGQLQVDHDQVREDGVPIMETDSALRDLLEAGKIRYIGLSNESPYEVGEWIKGTAELGIRDKLVSIQNSHSLLDRRFDADLPESCAPSVLAGVCCVANTEQINAREKAREKATGQSRLIRCPE